MPPEKELQPIESKLLDDKYRSSSLTVAQLVELTGLSTGAVRIALDGVRYRGGVQQRVVPPDATLAKLAAALGISAETLEGLGREEAAKQLTEIQRDKSIISPDREAEAAIAGRQSIVREMLQLFSTKELEAELERRQDLANKEHSEELKREMEADAADEWYQTR